MAQSFPPEAERFLREVGAVLLRCNKHRIYVLPNGKRIYCSNSPSTPRFMTYIRRDVRKALEAK